MRTLMMFS